MDTNTVVKPIIEALIEIARAQAASVGPVWVGIVVNGVLALATIAAVFIALWSAKSASHSVAATREVSSYSHLYDLLTQYDENDYLMRFWWLFEEIKDNWQQNGFWSLDKTNKVGNRSELWDDALGSRKSLRYDMLTFYDFFLRLNAWLVHWSDWKPKAKDIKLVNEFFGPQFVGTILKHRIIACTLKKNDRDREYYPNYFGLLDEKYTSITQLLLQDLIDKDRLSPTFRTIFPDWNKKVNEYLASLGDKGFSKQ